MIILTGVLSGSFVVNAQKPTTVTKPVSTANIGWRGTIIYKKTLVDTRSLNEPNFGTTNPTLERTKINYSRKYEYTAKVVFSTENGAITSNTKVSFGDSEMENGLVTRSTRCRSSEPDRLVSEKSFTTKTMDAVGQGRAEDFNIRAGSGVYSFGLRFPAVSGDSVRQTETTHENFCAGSAPAPPPTSSSQRFTIKDETLSIDGNLDPNNPDVIAGSKTWGDDGSGEIRSFRYQVSWRFTRKTSIAITDVKFEDMKFPEWNAWKEVSENESTIDGNEIKIKASVANLTGETKYVEVRFFETYKGDKYDSAKPDRALQGGLTEAPIVKLDAGEEREVEIPWKSEGYAWYDDGRPRPVQRFRAEAWESGTMKDSLVENLRVAPKPLILIPGVYSSVESFEIYQNLLTFAHTFAWKAAIFPKQPTSVYADADDLTEFVLATQKQNNAWHVDMAAHSSGGLVGRLYIHKQMPVQPDKRPTVKHLMMLGTPNLGVPCAQDLKKTKFDANFKLADELMPDEMKTFNKFVYERKGTDFSALAGNGSAILCGDLTDASGNDGFVSFLSATYGMPEYQLTTDSHQDLIKPEHFTDFIKPHVATGPRGTYPLVRTK